MSTAKLNVWITKKGEPCRIDDNPQEKQLYVYVLHCNGQILEWCGTKYVAMQAKCGHWEGEIPVGCYVVGAVENPFTSYTPLGNHLTHIAIVRADCGKEICVTLFNPTYHHCAHWFLTATKKNLTVGGPALPQNTTAAMRKALQPLEALVAAIPPDPFTVEMRGVENIPRPRETTAATEPAPRGTKKGGK